MLLAGKMDKPSFVGLGSDAPPAPRSPFPTSLPERHVPSRLSLRSRGEDAKLGDAGPVPRHPGTSGLAFSSGSMRLRGGGGCWMAPQRLSLCLTPRSLPERWAGVTRQRHRQRVKSLSCLFQTR